MKGAMKMALIRNSYDGGGAENRRRRDERGRYMEYDSYMPRQRRRMGFETPESRHYGGYEYNGYGAYDAMNDNDIRRRNTGEEDGYFAEQGEHERYPTNAYRSMRMQGGRQSGGEGRGRVMHMEQARDYVPPLTREKAEAWVRSMQNEDPERESGECWTIQEVKDIAREMNLPAEGKELVELYAVMNAMYSDYYKVAEKFDLLNDEFFACMAMAFINDKDAVENKTAAYYECVVKKGR